MGILTEEDKLYRYRNMRQFMSREGIDAMVCSGEGAVRYIAGHYYNTKWTQMLMFRDSDPVALMALPGREYLLTSVAKYQDDYWVKDSRINSPETVRDILVERVGAAAKVGITLGDIPASACLGLRKMLPDMTFVDVTESFKKIRRCKTGRELELLRLSPANVDDCCAGIPGFLKPGMTENQFWSYLEGKMRAAGAPDTLNQTCVDKRDISSVLPCWVHSQRPIEKGDLIAAEITSTAGGYWTQKIATISMGQPPQVVKDMNAAGSAAISRAAAMIKPGVNARDVLQIMDETIESAGFLSPRQFLTGPQGHLSGLDVDEGSFELDQDFILEEGMLFVLHPGTAVKGWKPGDYGIFGPGTMFLVTHDGVESLNKYPNDIIVVDC